MARRRRWVGQCPSGRCRRCRMGSDGICGALTWRRDVVPVCRALRHVDVSRMHGRVGTAVWVPPRSRIPPRAAWGATGAVRQGSAVAGGAYRLVIRCLKASAAGRGKGAWGETRGGKGSRCASTHRARRRTRRCRAGASGASIGGGRRDDRGSRARRVGAGMDRQCGAPACVTSRSGERIGERASERHGWSPQSRIRRLDWHIRGVAADVAS